MDIRPLDVLGTALDHTSKVLFVRFEAKKYIGLALCAWLMLLGTQPMPSPSVRLPGSDDPTRIPTLVMDYLEEVLEIDPMTILVPLAIGGMVLVVGGIMLALALWVLFAWIRSRAMFMLIDGIVHDRGQIVEPWRAFAHEANSLFRFRITIGLVLAALTTVPILLGAGAIGTWAYYSATPWIPAATGGVLLLMWIVPMVFLSVMFSFGMAALDDVVVPVMYARRCGIGEALASARDLISTDPASWLVYAIVRIAAGIAAGMVVWGLGWMTCFVSWLPFVNVLITLPIVVFIRSLALHFLAQFGDGYADMAPNTDG